MMSTTVKDLFKMTLPLSLAIVFFYWLFLARGVSKDFKETNKKYVDLKKRVSESGGENSKAFKKLATRQTQNQKMWNELFPSNQGSSHAMNQVQKVIAQNNMTLLEEGPTDIKINKLSRRFSGLSQQSLNSRRTEGEVWKMTLRGSYFSMMKVLKKIQGFPEFVVPVGIEMDTSNSSQSGQHLWVVFFWI